jgi:hypothetical protein
MLLFFYIISSTADLVQRLNELELSLQESRQRTQVAEARNLVAEARNFQQVVQDVLCVLKSMVNGGEAVKWNHVPSAQPLTQKEIVTLNFCLQKLNRSISVVTPQSHIQTFSNKLDHPCPDWLNDSSGDVDGTSKVATSTAGSEYIEEYLHVTFPNAPTHTGDQKHFTDINLAELNMTLTASSAEISTSSSTSSSSSSSSVALSSSDSNVDPSIILFDILEKMVMLIWALKQDIGDSSSKTISAPNERQVQRAIQAVLNVVGRPHGCVFVPANSATLYVYNPVNVGDAGVSSDVNNRLLLVGCSDLFMYWERCLVRVVQVKPFFKLRKYFAQAALEGLGVIGGLNSADWIVPSDAWTHDTFVAVPVIMCNGKLAYRLDITGPNSVLLDQAPVSMHDCFSDAIQVLKRQRDTVNSSDAASCPPTPWRFKTRAAVAAGLRDVKAKKQLFSSGCKPATVVFHDDGSDDGGGGGGGDGDGGGHGSGGGSGFRNDAGSSTGAVGVITSSAPHSDSGTKKGHALRVPLSQLTGVNEVMPMSLHERTRVYPLTQDNLAVWDSDPSLL